MISIVWHSCGKRRILGIGGARRSSMKLSWMPCGDSVKRGVPVRGVLFVSCGGSCRVLSPALLVRTSVQDDRPIKKRLVDVARYVSCFRQELFPCAGRFRMCPWSGRSKGQHVSHLQSHSQGPWLRLLFLLASTILSTSGASGWRKRDFMQS